MTEKERRSSSRYFAPVSLTAIASFPTKAGERIEVKDIGLDGFCFVTQTDISGESAFNLSLSFAGSGERLLKIDVSAEIIWHIHDEATLLHTAGTQFVELSEADEGSLREFLDSLKAKEASKEQPPINGNGAGS